MCQYLLRSVFFGCQECLICCYVPDVLILEHRSYSTRAFSASFLPYRRRTNSWQWEFLGNCSKPKNQENALHDAALFLQHEPTKNSPVRRIKVNLTPLEPPKRLEYSKVSVTSCSSIAGSASAAAESQGSLSGVRARLFGGTKSKLDLGKYRYQQPSSADQRKGVVKGGGASRRNMKLLRRSTFKKAVERHYSQLR